MNVINSTKVNFKNLDQYLKSGLIDNGIELNYHFKVIDRDGREVYRCSDYSDEGSESSYSQPLFLNDPPARMSIVKIHFPGKRDYIFDSVSFMIPSMIFTFVLLIQITVLYGIRQRTRCLGYRFRSVFTRNHCPGQF